jgi:hypothetical protein
VASEGSFDRNSSGCSISSHNSHDGPEVTTNQRKASFQYKAQSVVVPNNEKLLDSNQPKNPIYQNCEQAKPERVAFYPMCFQSGSN